MEKDNAVQIELSEPESTHDAQNATTKSTPADAEHMRRMGHEQQLVRNFELFSVAAFTAISIAAWEIGLFLISQGLLDGGRPALLYSIIWNFVGFGPIYLSMAEMASMAPIAGAQYHWVSEFAPESIQKMLSYFTGWTSTMAYQAGNAIGVFLVGTLVQSIIQINKPDYAFPPWHATLLVIGAVCIAFAGNVFGASVLSKWQNAVFCVHVTAYLLFIVPIWCNAPRATSKQVWTEFENAGGWSNMGLAVTVGQLSGIYTQVGCDNTKDAARMVPKAMMAVYVINFCLIFPAVLTVCYHIPVVSDALADPTLYPTIYVLRQTMSDGWLTGLLIIIVLLLICSNITYLAAVTRDMFAFARDHGLPFSGWISKVHPTRRIPQNATILTSLISIILSLIYIGSTVAFYAITSLLTVALMQCYRLSIGCLLWRRAAHPETLPPAHFSLGKAGIPVNVAAVLYALWAFFWSFWPQATPVTAEGFNWASVIFVGVLVVASTFFLVKARHVWTGPVALVEGRRSGI